MNRTYFPFYTLMIGFLVVVGCAAPEEEDILNYGYLGGGDRGSEDNFGIESETSHMAIFELENGDFTNPDEFEKYSKAKVLIVQPTYIWGPNFDPNIINTIKSINPDIIVLGYINAHSTWARWGELNPESFPYQAAWYESTSQYWSYTTTGDTMMSWPGKILLNTLNEDCRNAMVDVLAEQWFNQPNQLDGVFWDHFNSQLWVPDYIEGREGDLDLDSDGIPHLDDQDEMQAYRDASIALIQRFSSVIGPDVIQVTNGNRAARDSVFASLIDGMMYEVFPTIGINGSDMQSALNPQIEKNLFASNKWPRTTNGGPFLFLTNSGHINLLNGENENERWRRSEFNRVVALLTDSFVTYHPDSETYSYGWPEIEVNLGQPLGGVTINGETIIRDFENGRVLLDFAVGNSNAPFQFEIVENGEVLQSFLLE